MKIIVLCTLVSWMFTTDVSACDMSNKKHCRTGNIKCIHHVLQKMKRRFRKQAKACDHDAIFAFFYLQTTVTYLETAHDLGYEDVRSVTREDALFADYYFRAYDAYQHGGATVPPAWQIAFDAAADHDLPASGNALLGISAHIQRDLPFTLYELHQQGHPVSYHDHNLVNVYLAQVDIADAIIRDFDPTYPQGGDSSGVFYWRELAWQNYVRLRDAPTDQDRALVAAEIELAAAQAALFFAATTAYAPGADSSERDAYCEAGGAGQSP